MSSSNIPIEPLDRRQLLIQGGDVISAHDPETGAEFWRIDYNPERKKLWRLIPSLVTVDDLILATIPRGGPLMALKAVLMCPMPGRGKTSETMALPGSSTTLQPPPGRLYSGMPSAVMFSVCSSRFW